MTNWASTIQYRVAPPPPSVGGARILQRTAMRTSTKATAISGGGPIERERALAQIEDCLRAAEAGVGTLCLVSGEAGVGKTTLLRHCATVHAADARWLWGMCDPLSTPRTLGPLHDIARQLGGTLAYRLLAGASRESVFSAALDALGGARPTVFIIEDAHWADEATLELVLFLGRRLAALPAVVVLSYRDDEAAADPLFHATIGGLPADLVQHVALAPLSESGVAMLAAHAGRPADGLHAVTGGNPFFVAEMLAAGGLNGANADVPPTVRDAVLARTRRLSPEARQTLDLLAVVPGSIPLDLLDQSLHVSTTALQESVDAGLLVAGARTVAFRHQLTRHALDESLGPLRRRALHGVALAALADRYESIGDVSLASLVHHALAASDTDAVLRYAPLAAREAAAASAHREALRHYDAALAHADRLDDVARAELVEARSVEAYLNGYSVDALAARSAALAVWMARGQIERAGASHRWLSRLFWWSAEPEAAMREAQAAIRLLETLPPGHELAMAYSNLAQLHMNAHRDDEAMLWAGRAIELARAQGDQEALSHALTNLACARLSRGENAWRLLEEAWEIATRAGFDEQAQRALVNHAAIAQAWRQYPRAELQVERALEHAEAHDLPAFAQYGLGVRARIRLERGAWTAAERDAREVLMRRKYRGIQTLPALPVLLHIQARRGDPEAAEMLASARGCAAATKEIQRIGPVEAAHAEYLWLLGDQPGALAAARAGLAATMESRHPWLIGELAWWVHAAGGDVGASVAGIVAEPYRLALEGDWRAAAEAWDALGCPYERAEALARGTPEAALEALAIFDGLGATRRATLLRRTLRSRGWRVPAGPRRATRANRAGLTTRQMDVLRLLVEGCTNAEIAERLGTSPKTADHHVSAILGKLGAASRRAAVTTARRMGVLVAER